jgi:TonB family protein
MERNLSSAKAMRLFVIIPTVFAIGCDQSAGATSIQDGLNSVLGALGFRVSSNADAEKPSSGKPLPSKSPDRPLPAAVANRLATDAKNGVRVESVAMGAKKPSTKTVVEDTARKSGPWGNGPKSRSMVTEIQTANADVRGALSKEVVRRVVHSRISDVRLCYEQALVETPDVAGRVAIRFHVLKTGKVQTAGVESSSTNDAKLDDCIAHAVLQWTFPAPERGGVVVVTYPFTLSTTKTEK